MLRVKHPTAVGALPAVAESGAPGYFTGGNPLTSTPATVVTPEWLNRVQEELIAPILAAGLALDGAENNQLLQALEILINNALAPSVVPTGAMFPFTGTVAPAGYFITAGAAISRATYANLWDFALTSGNLAADGADYAANPGKYGPGDGVTTFNLPNVALDGGHFIRALPAGRAIGTFEPGQPGYHRHGIQTSANDPNGNSIANATAPEGWGGYSDYAGGTALDPETRPNNTAYPYILKY